MAKLAENCGILPEWKHFFHGAALRHCPAPRAFYWRLVAVGQTKRLALTAATERLLIHYPVGASHFRMDYRSGRKGFHGRSTYGIYTATPGGR